MKLLLIDDDEQVVKLVTSTLTAQGYTVDVAVDGLEGWDLLRFSPYDLVLLDVMLPKLDGIGLCRRLRAEKIQTPVILLTARDTSSDKLTGLDAGADDYLVKPLDLQELTARIRALLRRGSQEHSPVLEWGELQLNPATLEVTYAGQGLNLRRKEFAILELLMRHKQRVFSRGAILDQLWSIDETPSEATIKAHIKAIRHQLRSVGAEDLIETLYGQGYRLNAAYQKTATKPSAIADSSVQAAATRSAVARIWQQTKGVSFERLAILEQALQALQSGNLEDGLRQKAEQNAHKLHGSLGTFGLAEGSHLAKQLEQLFSSDASLEFKTAQIAQLVATLHHFLETSAETLSGASGVGTIVPLPRPAAISSPIVELPADAPLLLIIDDDASLTRQLAQEAANWKFRTAIAPNLTTARSQIRQNYPDIILLDLRFESGENGLTLLEELHAYRSQIPVVVFTEHDRFIDRVRVARLGGHVFLQKPTAASEVMRSVFQVMQHANKPDARILTVDDDPQILLMLKTLLEPWGLQLTALSQPEQFWEALEATQPDLIMLDIEMPEINGIELCQAIRSDPRWNWVPILFLTARTDADTMCRVYEVGADDYIAKPIITAELINRLLNRLERTRLLRSQAERDPMTGLANYQHSVQDLEKLLDLAQSAKQPVCFAVLEVDNLKRLNARYGHAAGEKALRQVGQLLKQLLRQEDTVARWSGAEFVVAIYGMTQSDGVEWLAEILETARSLDIVSASGERFHVSYSAGVVEYPIDGTDLSMLYRSADSVLYWAKAAGGDRVLPFGWQPVNAESINAPQVVLVHPETLFGNQLFQALETRGYHTQWFHNQEDALKQLAGDSPAIRSVAMIVGGFPESDGMGILKQCGSRTFKQCRVILLLSQPDLAEAALKLGVAEYVLTPCSVSVVMQSLRVALGHGNESRLHLSSFTPGA